MTWKDKLRPASFRGVPFMVDGDEGAFGRRVQKHEYPKRDKPYVEDMGKATRDLSLTGFLIGDDYLEQRDRMIVALETAGPGTLVHPWYGEIKVSLDGVGRIVHSKDHGGMCTLQLPFIESGDLSFPSATNSNGAKTLAGADTLQGVATDDFASRFKVGGLPSFVSLDAVQTFAQNLDILQDGIAGVGNLLANPLGALKDSASSLMPDAFGLAGSVFSMFSRGGSIVQAIGNIFGGGGSSSRNRDSVQALVGLSGVYNSRANVPVPSLITPSRLQAANNAAALNDLFSNAMLVQAAGMTAAMDFPVYDDAVAIRGGVTAALDKQSIDANDTVYLATQDLRSLVHRDITARLANSARLQTVSPRSGTPALVLAYERFGDVGREAEIVGLNRVRRPGFLPSDPIKVLSS